MGMLTGYSLWRFTSSLMTAQRVCVSLTMLLRFPPIGCERWMLCTNSIHNCTKRSTPSPMQLQHQNHKAQSGRRVGKWFVYYEYLGYILILSLTMDRHLFNGICHALGIWILTLCPLFLWIGNDVFY